MKCKFCVLVVSLPIVMAEMAHADGQINELVTLKQNQPPTNQNTYLTGSLRKTKILQLDQVTIDRLKVAREKMSVARFLQTTNKGPQNLQEAGEHILDHVALTSPPAVCVEYEEVFYFSFSGSTNLSDGLAIKKDAPTIYSWRTR